MDCGALSFVYKFFFQSTSRRVCAVSGTDHFCGYREFHFCSFRQIVWPLSLPLFHTHQPMNQRTSERTNEPTNQPNNQPYPSLPFSLPLPPAPSDTHTHTDRRSQQTTPVAAEAAGDVEVPAVSQQILARSKVYDVWMDLEPSGLRTYWTDRCSPRSQELRWQRRTS